MVIEEPSFTQARHTCHSEERKAFRDMLSQIEQHNRMGQRPPAELRAQYEDFVSHFAALSQGR